MTVKQIIDKANNMADEQVADADVLNFVNAAINKVNLEITTYFPNYDSTELNEEVIYIDIITPVDADAITETERILISQRTSMNNALVEIITRLTMYFIKVQDGSEFEYNEQRNVALTDLRQFLGQYKQFIKAEYKTLMLSDGSASELPAGVYGINEDNPYNPANTWSQDPGVGNSQNAGFATSDDPYGIK